MMDMDKANVIEVLNLYGFALDAKQWDLFDLIFTQDVTAEFGPASAVWTDLDTFKRAFAAFHQTLDNQQHQMMGQLVHVEGDTANAFSYGNWILIRNSAKGGHQWIGTGWYDDLLVRTGQGWRIKRRVCRLVSWAGNPAVPQPNIGQAPDMQTHVLGVHCEEGKVGYFNAIKAKQTQAG